MSTDQNVTPVADTRVQPPLPTRRTLRRRQNMPLQLGRFVALNIKMLRMVFRGHG